MEKIKHKNKIKIKKKTNNNNKKTLNGVNNKFNSYEFNRYLESLSESIEEKISEISGFTTFKIKDTNKEFDKFLNKNAFDSFEDNTKYKIPNIQGLYCDEHQLGKDINNKDDYIFRTNRLIEVMNINRNEFNNEPLNEPNDESNIQNDNIELELNIDENEIPNQPTINDEEIRNKLEYILNYWRNNRKKIKLFIGFDTNSDNIFYRIYGKGLDKNGKIKNIEYHRYWIWHGEDWIEMNLEKSIKELYDVDALKIDDLLERIDDIINKFNV